MSSLPQTGKTTAAVITGGHAFDVPGFHALFRSLPDVDAYIQPLEDLVSDVAKVREQYNVLVFYNMHRDLPSDAGSRAERRARAALEALGNTGQGILLLHHAILAYRDWSHWSGMVGIPDRSLTSYHHDEKLNIRVADSGHPITQGLQDWEMIDETYVMHDPGNDSDILLTADHPQSMHAIGWARTLNSTRIFCLQSGHDNQTYTDPNFRALLARGIQWCAKRI